MSDTQHIGKSGKIQSGEYTGWNISSEFDSKNTGGYYLYLESVNKAEGFDYWFEDTEALDSFLMSCGWSITWM